MKAGDRTIADWRARGASSYDITAYSVQNGPIYPVYRATFVGGCKGIPQAGREVIGTRFQYDARGNFISSWTIAPDTSRAELEVSRGVAGGKRHYIYRDKELDSIRYFDKVGKLRGATHLGGTVCINFSNFYVLELNDIFQGYSQGSPYLYDTLIHRGYDSLGRLQFRTLRTSDSTVDEAYFPNGNLKSKHECAERKGEGCLTYIRNEWRADGKPYIAQFRNGNRYIHRLYHENGNLMTESYYRGAKLDTLYRAWHENGRVRLRIEYDMGLEVKVQEYDSLGNEVEPKPYGPAMEDEAEDEAEEGS
jgi:antitoxin component YwqK of YwqJK toxin-antitoxin module